MFEILTALGIVLIAATAAFKRRETDRGKSARSATTLPKLARALRTPALLDEGSKNSDGREARSTFRAPCDARFAFVSAFGVSPRQLRELHIYSVAGPFDEFPHKVSELLKKLHANGFAVGQDIMGVIHHGRRLKEGEAIYVAVVRDEAKSATRTVAFLDRYRTC
jgi:hypothetical protein